MPWAYRCPHGSVSGPGLGRVQGVYFRNACRKVAQQHGVNGWVRNLPGGSVEAVFKGSDDAVRRLVEWAGRGPRAAVVKDVRVQAEPPKGDHCIPDRPRLRSYCRIRTSRHRVRRWGRERSVGVFLASAVGAAPLSILAPWVRFRCECADM